MRLITLLLLLAVALAACGNGPTPGAGEVTPEVPPVDAGAPRPAIVIYRDDLVIALEAQGAAVEVAETVEQPFLTPEGRILRVDGATVQVFEYPGEEAMEREAAQLTEGGGPLVTWVDDPHFYKSGRILVLYVGSDPAILDLLENTVGPQFAGL